MICNNCGSETKGIKLNGKLFCTNCGEALLVSDAQSPTSQTSSQPPQPEIPKEAPAVPTPIQPQASPQALQTSAPKPPLHNEPLRPPEPKIISPEGVDTSKTKKELATLEAEEKVLELVEENTKKEADDIKKAAIKDEQFSQLLALETMEAPTTDVKVAANAEIAEQRKAAFKSAEIKKHNRDRIAHKKAKEWMMIPNEPDLEEKPELGAPTEDQIEPPKEALAEKEIGETDLDLVHPKEMPVEKSEETFIRSFSAPPENVDEDITPQEKISKQKALGEYLKATAVTTPVQKKRIKEKRKRKKHGYKKFFVVLIILLLLIFSFIGLVLYVNLYAINPNRARESAEATVTFSYKKPSYVPSGYEISYKTNAGQNFIDYVYEYTPDKSKTLEIKISKTDLTKENLFSEKVQKLGKSYAQITKEDINFYFVEENSFYFVKDGLMYEIVSSSNISQDELTKIASGLL